MARRTSSRASSGAIAPAWVGSADETGTAPAELGAEVIVVARLGANEPAAGIIEGGSALWSRSWKVDSEALRALSSTWLRNSRWTTWCTWWPARARTTRNRAWTVRLTM